jgi:5'(3')-deoxyribonucleotidase
MKKKIIYVDMDDVLCEFSKSQSEALKCNPNIEFPQSQYNFFRKLSPMKDGVSTVQYLANLEMFEVYILTAPSIRNPLCYTEKRLWVEDYFGLDMVERLIITPNKGLNKGDYLIDDYDSGRGQENFEGKLLKFGSNEFPNWQSVLSYFKTKYNLDNT